MNTKIKEIIATILKEQTEDENITEAVMAAPDEVLEETIFELYGQPVIPVAVLRQHGISVSINHSRWIKGAGIRKTREFIAAGISPSKFEPRGGRTEARVSFPDGEVYEGKSVCVRGDTYRAIDKALNSKPVSA